jgi:hypothetical protein
MTKTFTNSFFSFAATLLVFQSVVCWAVKKNVNDSTGLYIKHNSLYIAANGTGLTTFGNLYLDSVQTVGQGTLTMQSTSPKTLTAKHSTIANLAISNPTVVTLVGSLSITHSLSIAQGIFDATAASLTISPTATVLCTHGGTWLNSTTIHAALPLSRCYHAPTVGSYMLAAPSLCQHPPVSIDTHTPNKQYAHSIYTHTYIGTASPPPEA